MPLLPQRVWAGGQRLTAGQFFEASLISETMRGWEEGETEVADDFTPPSKRAWGPEGSLRRDAVPLMPPPSRAAPPLHDPVVRWCSGFPPNTGGTREPELPSRTAKKDLS